MIYNIIIFFRENDFKESDKVAVISENSVNWAAVDIACMFAKLISIPIYTSLSSSQTKYILEDSDSKVCFVSNSLLLEKALQIRKDLPAMKYIVSFNKVSDEKLTDKDVILYSGISEKEIRLSDTEIIEFLESMNKGIAGKDLLTIIYTSGTTGVPKGVMLSHGNVSSNIEACQKVIPIDMTDSFLSFLPYSHAYERTAGYYLPLFSGAKIYYAQSIETIGKQLPETNPTIVISVPRLLDKIYHKLMNSGIEMKGGLKKKIFNSAIKIAKDESISKRSLKWKIADRLVYKEIRKKTGNKLRFFVSGGGALNKTVGHFFDRIGITIIEGYGMTETSPVISVNSPDRNKYGTVGMPLDGVNVKLSEDNEILIKGELVMQGYYKDEKGTMDMIKNGWLHSGDIGEFDSDGFLKITDRKKSLMKTSGGKYILPSHIEELFMTLNYVENVMIIGNGRMYVTALIVPDKVQLLNYADRNNIKFDSYPELLEMNSLIRLVRDDINILQSELANYERVRKFTLLVNSFSIEGGELTPTMKVKRKFVEEKFRDEIENMYLKI
jgi:long-chain acyl-CoA synthetase